jgi:hypothetical protein
MPTQSEPVAFWSENGAPGQPRREILSGVSDGAPETLAIAAAEPPRGEFTGPEVSLGVLERRFDIALAYETNELVLRMNGRRLGIRVGLLTDQGLHWWHWVKLETLSSGPVCRSVRAMGAIPVHFEGEADMPPPGEINEYRWLHRHNHVRGEVFARCYANGVLELCLRHVNGFFFTEGGELSGVVPVFGFTAGPGDTLPDEQSVTGPRRWTMGGVQIDTADAAQLVSEARPGKLWKQGDVLVYQPYEGVEVLAGTNCEARTGDAYLCRASQRRIPKGVARTARMVASMAGAPPEVGVYLAPSWWYGVCEDLLPAAVLPVHDSCDEVLRRAEHWLNTNLYQNCFDDGAECRGALVSDDGRPGEPGWEGEAPYAHLLAAYLSGSAETYDLAIRSCYHLADVGTDHAFLAVRMHAYEAGGHALPMQRILGHYAGYLETGDPFLSETAMAVADHAYWWDKTHYPRRSIGRDAAYIRGLLFLYRYTGEGLYLRRAREAIGRVIAVQYPDGCFSDQGGTTGIHGALNLVIKPWMGCIAAEPLIDYLQFCPDDKEVADAALRYADWLLTHRVRDGGQTYWPYQWGFGDQPTYPNLYGPPWPMPTKGAWHVEYVAKVLGWASFATGKPDYYRVWQESFTAYGTKPSWDHGAGKAVQNLIWQRAKLWSARLRAGGIEVSPRPDVAGESLSAQVESPLGTIEVSADQPGRKFIPLSLDA